MTRPPEGTGPEVLRSALGALRAAGVLHGVDAAKVSAAIGAADGQAHPVAQAREPRAPVDAALVVAFADAAAADPLHTVARGTELARCTPAVEGRPGMTVRGEPIPVGEARAAAIAAGDGTEVRTDETGATVVVAARDGRPALVDGLVTVAETVEVPSVAGGGEPVTVLGALRVTGDVGEGAHVTVSGSLEIGGTVDRAQLEAGGDVVLEGSCTGTTVAAGGRRGLHRAIAQAIEDGDALGTACAIAGQLVEAGAANGRQVPFGEALATAVDARFPDLRSALAAAAGAAGRDASAEGRRVAALVADVVALLDRAGERKTVTADEAAAAARELAGLVSEARAGAETGGDLRAHYLQGGGVTTTGSLLLTGPGTYNVEIVVAGDVRAEGANATVRGGSLSAGGRIAVHEIGAPGGAPVRITLEGAHRGQRLATSAAHPGVEVVCGRQAG